MTRCVILNAIHFCEFVCSLETVSAPFMSFVMSEAHIFTEGPHRDTLDPQLQIFCVCSLFFQFASTSVTMEGKRWIIDGHAISWNPSSRSIRGIDGLQIYQQEQDVSSETSDE